MSKPNIINIFEHQRLIVGDFPGFTDKVFKQLEKYYGVKGTPFFSLIHNGVKFNEHVGVIQIGSTTINVLPKIDKTISQTSTWAKVLISMLKFTSGIEASATSTSDLQLKSNSIFDLYLELFIHECQKLTHQGLNKRYREITENHTALKGRLHIPGQIRENLIHKERFNVTFNVHDQNHLINRILKKTLHVIANLPTRFDLKGKIKKLLLHFEEVGDCTVHPGIFETIHLDRNSIRYAEALGVAKLILLNYHPDLSRGHNHVLALMFDMNKLWESFITKIVKKHFRDKYYVKAQNQKVFWESNTTKKRLKPDLILISKSNSDDRVIVDTKWKTPSNIVPSDEDLRQVFAYNLLFESQNAILLYPGSGRQKHGHFKVGKAGVGSLQTVNILDSSNNLVTNNDLLQQLNLEVLDNDTMKETSVEV